MCQEAYNLWSLIIGALGLLVSAAVAVVVGYYTLETKRLRLQSEQQTSVFRDQLCVSQRQAGLFAEQVQFATRPFVMCEFTPFEPGGSMFPPGQPESRVKVSYRGMLWNPTDRVAHDLRVLVHGRSLGYFWSEEPPVLQKIGEVAVWSASGPVDKQYALSLPGTVYGQQWMDWHIRVLEQHEDQDYVVVFFRDANSTPYASLSLIRDLEKMDYQLHLTQILRPPK
jgi:hypothetical protein